jgi:hypothetical protein
MEWELAATLQPLLIGFAPAKVVVSFRKRAEALGPGWP